MKSIYLDNASTTPTDPAVLKAMQPYFYESFGNASSPHHIGQRARKALEDSRHIIAQSLGATPDNIIFTSGATEANNHAIFATALSSISKGRHVIVSAIEHHSVLESAHRLEKLGYEVSFVKPDRQGIIAVESVQELIRPQTVLIAIHHANNEIGTIQPIEQVGSLARQHQIIFLVDATQSVGHMSIDVRKLGCDFLSLSAHKFYGPPGVGALYVREGVKLEPRVHGGDQEMGRRAGTPNLPGIVGMAKAIEIAQSRIEQEAREQSALRDFVIDFVLQNIQGSHLNGSRQQRLANNAHFSFEGIKAEDLVTALDMAGIAVSQGSACKSGALKPSHVLKAIGLSDDLALGSVRITLGRWTTRADIEYVLEQLKAKVDHLRRRQS